MNITLREITKDNYEDICDLEVAEDQKRHLSSNMESILDSKFHESLTARAIYSDDIPVGFIMGERTTAAKVEIYRFMIDINFQKKGIGCSALELAITEIKKIEGIKQIQICYHPDNEIAKSLYFKIGFKEVGMNDSDDDMLAVMSV